LSLAESSKRLVAVFESWRFSLPTPEDVFVATLEVADGDDPSWARTTLTESSSKRVKPNLPGFFQNRWTARRIVAFSQGKIIFSMCLCPLWEFG
jgi:hypothetical protein